MEQSKQLPSVVKQGGLMSPEDLANMKSIAQVFVEAGMFEVSDKDAQKGITPEKKQAIATVQIMAGQEMGLSPFQAMKGMHIIKGKATPGYQTLGALVKASPRHDYTVKQFDNDAAEIEFFKDGKPIGKSRFDTEDMKRANLGGDNWMKYKRNMLFSKAMSTGVNTFCPEVTMGPVYTPEDFGATEDEQGNLIVEEATDEKKSKSTRKSRSATAGKSSASTKTNSSNTTTPTQASETTKEPEPEAADVEVVEENSDDKGEVTVEVFGQILEAATANGWTEAQAEEWIGTFFESHEVNTEVESLKELAAQLSWGLVESAINYVMSNKPE